MDTKHIAMILDPMEWPRWPILPVKNAGRYNNQQQNDHGIIIAVTGYYSDDKTCRIYVWHTNMFMIPCKQVKNSANDGTHSVIDFEVLQQGSWESFADAEAVVDAGWAVD